MTGQAVTNVGDVGEHYPLFLIEKSHHPENITVVYTKLDMHCRVIPHREHGLLPTLGFYWLMDATRYKPMAGPLKAGARKRLQFIDAHGSQGDATSFLVHTDALSRVQHDLPSPAVQIKAERRGDACVATAFLTLGPSNGHATIKVVHRHQDRTNHAAQENASNSGSGRHPDLRRDREGHRRCDRPADRAHIPAAN